LRKYFGTRAFKRFRCRWDRRENGVDIYEAVKRIYGEQVEEP